MDAGQAPARQARAQPRHELRTLTYVTLDQANGGIVRNLSHEGIAIQAVAAVRPGKEVGVRLELRAPRLSVETRGEVVWSTNSGQCGIRFLDLSPEMSQQINEWIFSNLIEGIALHSGSSGLMFAESSAAGRMLAAPATDTVAPAIDEAEDEADEEFEDEDDDGLIVSATPVNVIELPARPQPPAPVPIREETAALPSLQAAEADWLSQPLSGRSLAWTVNTLVVIAALLLFTLVFLVVTRELPRWPLSAAAGGAILMTALYWGFCKAIAGASFGAKLARMSEADGADEGEASGARFR